MRGSNSTGGWRRATADELAPPHPAQSLKWLRILKRGLGHHPVLIEALEGDRSAGWLPLARVESWLFGRMLVSLPYVNLAGLHVAPGAGAAASAALVEEAVQLASAWDVRYLELRQAQPTVHPALAETNTAKVRMVRKLPATPEALWDSFKSKLRSQIKSGQKRGLEVVWGGSTLLDEFYAIFARNMRDLGTPVYPRRLFAAILDELAGDADHPGRTGRRCRTVRGARPRTCPRGRPARAWPGHQRSAQRQLPAGIQPHQRQHGPVLEPPGASGRAGPAHV